MRNAPVLTRRVRYHPRRPSQRETILILNAPSVGDPVGSLVRQLSDRLGSRLEAELLLSHVLEVERSWLYAHADVTPSEAQSTLVHSLAERRRRGEPLAYLIGYREFYGRRFIVSPAVLIPRPETELVVETALEKISKADAAVVDVGTGSGCIALTLAAERPQWRVSALDWSHQALTVCRQNAAQLSLADVEILHGDLLAPVAGRRFDAVVSNPPYVAVEDPHLMQGDLRFEPDLALSAEQGGYAVIQRLVNQAAVCLRPGGWLIIEHGYDQAEGVQRRLAAAGFTQVSTRKDLAGIDRVTLGVLA